MKKLLKAVITGGQKMSKKLLPSHGEWVKNLQYTDLATGIRMAYMEVGDTDNPPLIISHGFCDNSRSTRQMVETYQNYFHVFSVDNRGHGQSEKPECYAYPSAMLGEDLLAFADNMGLETFFLSGQSMGSMASQYVAFSHPERVRKLALISSMCWFHSTPEEFNDALANLKRYTENPPKLEEELPTVSTFTDQEFGPVFYKEMLEWPMHARLAAWRGMLMTDHRRFLQYIEAPALIIWGENDDLITQEYKSEFKRLMPEAQYIELPGGSHEIQQEQPDKISEKVTEFFLG